MILFYFSVCQVFAFDIINNDTEEFLNSRHSSVSLFKKDSTTLQLEYNKVLNSYENEDFFSALDNALKLRDKSKEEKNYYITYKCLYLIGNIYEITNKFNESLNNYKESLKFFEITVKEKRSSDLILDHDYIKTLFKIGNLYFMLSVSIEENNKLNYLDSTKIYYQKIIDLPNLNKNIENIKASTYSNLSGIFEQDSIFDKSEEYVRKAIEIHKKYNNKLGEAKSLNNLANVYLSQKEYQKSKDIYLEALKLIENNSDSKAFRTKADLHYNLAWAMRNLEDYKAYDHQEKSYEIQDAIRDKEISTIVEELGRKYDFNSKKEILLEKEENKRLKQQRTFWVLGVVALLIISSLTYIINLNKLKQKNLALSFSQKELLKNQEIEKIKSESQARILNATIDGKESERKQIAETLHDSVSALLSSANLHLQATRKQFNGNTPIEIDKTQRIIEEASDKVRGLSHNLMSSVLLKFGLKFAIRDLSDKFSNSELTIHTDIAEIRRYDQSFEIKVHNIILEFVNNVIKHSKANNALVQLKEENKVLFLKISDDGIGFDKNKIDVKDGLGINQIEARIQMMKGKFDIDSSKNNGTKISVEIPVLEKEELNLV
ncbi:tetratricopeptide repeat protein [Polaribacter sp. R77954]|uniref:tetratricopeptide repeat-containing sensor histidine kinase n=1 Tax=Polaribacter sp. R77954 TaxID=3093870 RepID=UPI0037CCB3DE